MPARRGPGAAPVAVAVAAAWASAVAGQPVPAQLRVPETVRLGEVAGTDLTFEHGRPAGDTAEETYDLLDLARGMEVYLNFLPGAAMQALREGLQNDLGVGPPLTGMITRQALQAGPLLLTGTSDWVYAIVPLNLFRDGPVVVEVPPDCGPGLVNDAFSRFVAALGSAGPDAGKGGRYLILPPDYRGPYKPTPGDTQAGVQGLSFYIRQSLCFKNVLLFRGALDFGSPTESARRFEEGLKVYSFGDLGGNTKMEWVDGSGSNGKEWNGIYPNTFAYFNLTARALYDESDRCFNSELLGLAASIGVQKGRPFTPPRGRARALRKAVELGVSAARTVFFEPRGRTKYLYADDLESFWVPFRANGEETEWKDRTSSFWAGKSGGVLKNSRISYFYSTVFVGPSEIAPGPSSSVAAALSNRDMNGDYLDGARFYTLNLPADVPAAMFWSVTAYDPESRSMLRTPERFPSCNSARDQLFPSDDGSYTIYLGPQPPASSYAQRNWIQTDPEKGLFVILRLFGATPAWYAGLESPTAGWRAGDLRVDERTAAYHNSTTVG